MKIRRKDKTRKGLNAEDVLYGNSENKGQLNKRVNIRNCLRCCPNHSDK